MLEKIEEMFQLFLKTFFVKLILELDAIIEWLTGHVGVPFVVFVQNPLAVRA